MDFYSPSQEQNNAKQDEVPESWLDRLAEYLCFTGITGKEEAEVAVASIWKAHIIEEQVIDLYLQIDWFILCTCLSFP